MPGARVHAGAERMASGPKGGRDGGGAADADGTEPGGGPFETGGATHRRPGVATRRDASKRATATATSATHPPGPGPGLPKTAAQLVPSCRLIITSEFKAQLEALRLRRNLNISTDRRISKAGVEW